MRRILCSDWLPERARWSDTRPRLPVPFPQIKFRQSSSECAKVFSNHNKKILINNNNITPQNECNCRKKFRGKKPFVHSLELWWNFICANETGIPGQAVSLHLARSGSQSEHRIRRILPAHGACHIIIIIYMMLLMVASVFSQVNNWGNRDI